MNGEEVPQIHPSQRLIAPDGTWADIDAEMVPLIRALWALGFTTLACCQDFGEGTAGQRKASQRQSRYGGDAFIAYYTGFAWLKIPLPDARRLANILHGTEFHDRVALRWTPGSWRMHVPIIFDKHLGFSLDNAAQVYFPREQISSLTLALECLRRVQ